MHASCVVLHRVSIFQYFTAFHFLKYFNFFVHGLNAKFPFVTAQCFIHAWLISTPNPSQCPSCESFRLLCFASRIKWFVTFFSHCCFRFFLFFEDPTGAIVYIIFHSFIPWKFCFNLPNAVTCNISWWIRWKDGSFWCALIRLRKGMERVVWSSHLVPFHLEHRVYQHVYYTVNFSWKQRHRRSSAVSQSLSLYVIDVPRINLSSSSYM